MTIHGKEANRLCWFVMQLFKLANKKYSIADGHGVFEKLRKSSSTIAPVIGRLRHLLLQLYCHNLYNREDAITWQGNTLFIHGNASNCTIKVEKNSFLVFISINNKLVTFRLIDLSFSDPSQISSSVSNAILELYDVANKLR